MRIDFDIAAYDFPTIQWSNFDISFEFEKYSAIQTREGEGLLRFADWQRAKNCPKEHDSLIALVEHPFSEELESLFWTVFHPEFKAEDDSRGDHPDVLEQSAFVQAKLKKVIWKNEYSAWVLLEITDVIKFSGIHKELKPKRNSISENFIIETYKKPTWFANSENFISVGMSLGGDLGNEAIINYQLEYPTVIAISAFRFHSNYIYACNSPQNPDKLKKQLKKWSKK